MTLAAYGLGWAARGVPIVTGVSFDLGEGEMLGLVGPNGSGKSTLLRLLAGTRLPTSGTVMLGGTPLRGMARRDIARQLALVEQSADTTELIRVRDAVALGRTPWLNALSPWSTGDEAMVQGALAKVEMTGLAGRMWHTLSGGERQRVQIARALAQDPRVLLLDEPTNHLDIHHQLGILKLVHSLPVTTIIALHDLNYAFACDRVGVMDRGCLIAIGKPEEVLTPQRIGDVFGVQVRFVPDPEARRPILRFQSM
jgi:iron complex transport system ATP-binding protein